MNTHDQGGTYEYNRDRKSLKKFKDYYRTQKPDPRNYALVVLGLNTALRISDILNLTYDMVYHKQRWTRGYKRYKETSGLIEWKECQIFHSIFT